MSPDRRILGGRRCGKYFAGCLVGLAGLALPRPAPCRENVTSASPAVVFVTHYLERGDFATTPRPEQVQDGIRVLAAPGEYEPATFCVRASRELKAVAVQLTDDLQGANGERISRAAVDIRLVDPFEEWTGKKMEYFLLKRQAVDIPANTTRRFWVTIRVPADAGPGLYRATLLVGKTVTEVGPDLGRVETLKTLAYEVEVLPVTLLPARDTGMAFFMYHNTGYYADEFVTEEYQARVFEDMREHGMTTATLYLYPVVDGAFSMTARTSKHLGFTQTMAMLEKTKLVAPGLPVVWLGAESYGPEVWKRVLDEAVRNKWPEIVFYAVDEPGVEDRNKRVRTIMPKLNSFRRAFPGYGLRLTTALGSSRGIQTVGHYYDLWIGCMAQRIGESGVIADAKMRRKELWTYDCMLAPVDAETDRYYFGVWAWVSGVKGCSHWAYFDGKPRLSYVRPMQDEIVPTIGWEAVREGIDDYRYLATLRHLAGEARAAGKDDLAGGADAIFEEVRQMVTMDNYGKAYHKAAGSGVELATAYRRPRVEPHLSLDAYDRMRRNVAREIERIAAALGEE